MFSPLRSLILLVLALGLVGGCYQERVVKDTWGEFGRSYGNVSTGRSSKTARLSQPVAEEYWTIRLASFDTAKQARKQLKKLQRKKNIPDLWVADRARGALLCRGKYSNPATAMVQNDLRQSLLTFPDAKIIAASIGVADSNMNLKRYRQQGLWTLQVAVYDDLIGKDFRKKAEEAAVVFRNDGEKAFFYHGPHRSMVTIGIYSYEQAWTQRLRVGDTYSPAILQLQERYPYNLYNGRTVVEKSGGKVLRQQPSFLVKVQ